MGCVLELAVLDDVLPHIFEILAVQVVRHAARSQFGLGHLLKLSMAASLEFMGDPAGKKPTILECKSQVLINFRMFHWPMDLS